MKIVMNLQNLVMLTVILFILYTVLLKKKEKLTNTEKDCSQNDINKAYSDYVFGIRQGLR